jgi:hypothetical protein
VILPQIRRSELATDDSGNARISPNWDTAGSDAGPAFVSLASLPGQTEQALHNWLAEPHPPMFNLDLTAVEFDDLAVYIMSLKQ